MADLDKNQKKAFNDAEKIIVNYEKDILKIYRGSLTRIRAKLSILNEKKYWSLNEMFKFDRLNTLNDLIKKEIFSINKEVLKELEGTEKQIINETYNRSWYGFEKTLDTSLAFNKINPDVVKEMIKFPYPGVALNDLMRKNMIDSIDKIKFEIGQALTMGDGPAKTAKRIKKQLGTNYFESVRIARTEGLRASSKAQLIASGKAKSLGIETEKIWLDTDDIRTRKTHENVGKAGEDGTFTVGGVIFDAPRIVSEKNNNPNTAKEVIHCRCTYYEEIKDLEKKIAKKPKDEDYYNKLLFDDWKKDKGV
jgi:hypothetical protein